MAKCDKECDGAALGAPFYAQPERRASLAWRRSRVGFGGVQAICHGPNIRILVRNTRLTNVGTTREYHVSPSFNTFAGSLTDQMRLAVVRWPARKYQHDSRERNIADDSIHYTKRETQWPLIFLPPTIQTVPHGPVLRGTSLS